MVSRGVPLTGDGHAAEGGAGVANATAVASATLQPPRETRLEWRIAQHTWT